MKITDKTLLPYPSWAEVDLDRLHHNVDVISAAAKTPLIPVIKAGAYGHGAAVIGRELSRRKETAMLSVWNMDEAQALRKAGIKGRILVLGGVWPWDGKRAVDLGVETVISSLAQAKLLALAAGGRAPARVHFKINTGMSRLGVDRQEAFDAFARLSAMKNVRIEGMMTHFATAGSSKAKVLRQCRAFDEVAGALRGAGYSIPPRHAANTAALFLHPEARYDLTRPGIGLYGIKEFPGPDRGLKPIMSLKARVAWTRKVAKGETVSYDGMWKSPGSRQVAVVSMGYADGYSRILSNRAHAIINGKKARQIGAICMDSALFDVTGSGGGEVAVIIGEAGGLQVAAGSLARLAGTISYEILCGIGNRVRRIYLRAGRIDRKLTYPAP